MIPYWTAKNTKKNLKRQPHKQTLRTKFFCIVSSFGFLLNAFQIIYGFSRDSFMKRYIAIPICSAVCTALIHLAFTHGIHQLPIGKWRINCCHIFLTNRLFPRWFSLGPPKTLLLSECMKKNRRKNQLAQQSRLAWGTGVNFNLIIGHHFSY